MGVSVAPGQPSEPEYVSVAAWPMGVSEAPGQPSEPI